MKKLARLIASAVANPGQVAQNLLVAVIAILVCGYIFVACFPVPPLVNFAKSAAPKLLCLGFVLAFFVALVTPAKTAAKSRRPARHHWWNPFHHHPHPPRVR